jgi:hypothetical protein
VCVCVCEGGQESWSSSDLDIIALMMKLTCYNLNSI